MNELNTQILAYAMAFLLELDKKERSMYDLYQLAHEVLENCPNNFKQNVLENDDLDSDYIRNLCISAI